MIVIVLLASWWWCGENASAVELPDTKIESNKSLTNRQYQVDLSRLLSDVSRTFSGISSILGGVGIHDRKVSQDVPRSEGRELEDEPHASVFDGGLFDGSNVCFKTCGMEDIQFAARVCSFFRRENFLGRCTLLKNNTQSITQIFVKFCLF